MNLSGNVWIFFMIIFPIVLSLPNRTVFSEFLREDQHVVGISIGNLRASSFIDTLTTCVADQYTLKAPTVQVFIPMLTGPDPDGPPQYKLVVNSYVSTQKPFVQPNVAVPTTQVEQLIFNERGLSIKDGDEYLNINWKESDMCQSINPAPLNDLEEFTDELMLPYNYQLNFSACDGVGVQDVDLCKTYEKLSCLLSRNKYNACQYWTILGPFKNCKLEAFSLNAISPEFKASTLLSEESGLPFIAALQTDVDFQVNLKIPCIED